MSKHIPQQELLHEMEHLFKRFAADGDLAPVQTREEWEKLVGAMLSDEQQLLRELGNFADLWRYFQDRKKKLGPEIVNRIGQLHELAVAQRISELKEINQTLLQRINHVDQDSKRRH